MAFNPTLPQVFEPILGQESAKRILAAACSRPAHAYLFLGPPQVGKRRLAKAFAQALNCTAPEPGCGACAECRSVVQDTCDRADRLILRVEADGQVTTEKAKDDRPWSRHPDVRFWEPDGRTTKIAQVRELVFQAQMHAFRGRAKVHVLEADTLTTEAANCLLKTLEEPPSGTVLVLLAGDVRAVLPTLRSRCQTVPFGPVPDTAIATWLVGQQFRPEAAHKLASWATGRPGRALSLAAAGEPPDLDAFLVPRWDRTLPEAERLAGAAELLQLTALEALVDTAAGGVRDAVARDLPPVQADQEVARWAAVARVADKTRRGLLAHGNPKLLWSALANQLLELAPAKAHGA